MSEEIKVVEFENICKKISELRDERDSLNSKLSVVEQELKEAQDNAQKMLEAVDKDSYKSEYGTIHTITRTQYGVPKGENKIKFLEHLKQVGLHDEVVTVNAQWLKGYVNREKEFAKDNGVEFVLPPGIEPSYTETTTGFRKK